MTLSALVLAPLLVQAPATPALTGSASRPGRTGNEVLAATLAAMRAAGITGTVYSHPIGDRGHGAGPDAALGADGTIHWILRRQTAFHIVR